MSSVPAQPDAGSRRPCRARQRSGERFEGGRRTAQPRATVRGDSRRRRGRAFGTAEVGRQRHGGPCSAPGVYLCLLL